MAKPKPDTLESYCFDLEIQGGRSGKQEKLPRGDLVVTHVREAIPHLRDLLPENLITFLEEHAELAKSRSSREAAKKSVLDTAPIYYALTVNTPIDRFPEVAQYMRLALLIIFVQGVPHHPEAKEKIVHFLANYGKAKNSSLESLVANLPGLRELKTDKLPTAISRLGELKSLKAAEKGTDPLLPSYYDALSEALQILHLAVKKAAPQGEAVPESEPRGPSHEPEPEPEPDHSPSKPQKRKSTSRRKPSQSVTQQFVRSVTGGRTRPLKTKRQTPPEIEPGQETWTHSGFGAIQPPDEPPPPIDGLAVGVSGDEECIDDAVAHTLGLRGHWLRLNNHFAERSSEAFSPTESKKALDVLLTLGSMDTLAAEAARFIWVLVALLGRRYDDLVYAFSGAESTELCGIREIQRDGDLLIITCSHLLPEDKLTDSISQPASPVHRKVQLFLRLPKKKRTVVQNGEVVEQELEWPLLDEILGFLATCTSDTYNLRLLLAHKYLIRKHIRRHFIDRFTETRLRGSLVQATLQLNFDYPLTQLIFGEMLDVSAASLHYLYWEQWEIQSVLNQALQNLYGSRIPEQHPGTNELYGAPKAAVSENLLAPIAEWAQTVYQDLEKLHVTDDFRSRHNIHVELTLSLLGIGGAHRHTQDLVSLTLNDICFSDGLAIFRDKPSDASIYRRLVVIPSSALGCLHHLLAWLTAIKNSSHVEHDESAKNAIQNALSGKGSLFFIFRDDGSIGNAHTGTLFDRFLPNVPKDICRHKQSKDLRRFGAHPLMIEAHIGHHFGGPVFGKRGIISPSEFAHYLRPYLDRWMTEAGFPTPPTISRVPNKPTYSKATLLAIADQEREDDAKQLARQWKLQLEEHTRPAKIPELITQVLEEYVPDYKRWKAPAGITISREMALEIRNKVISNLGADLVGISIACRSLRNRLRFHRNRANWKVKFPPAIAWDVRPPLPITRANIAALDQLVTLREQFLQYVEQNNNLNHYLLARCALILWGDCNSWTDSKIWLDHAISKRPHKDEEFLLIDIGNEEKSESRTVSGIPWLFVAAWIRSGAHKNNSQVSTIFEKSINAETLVTTTQFARYLSQGFLFADLLNEKLPHIELPTDRVRHWLDNTWGYVSDNIDFDNIFTERRRIRGRSGDLDKDKVDIEMLKTLVKAPSKRILSTGKGRARSKKSAIIDWCLSENLSPTVELITLWVLELLKPGANLKTGGQLKKTTISNYITNVWDPLHTAFSTYDISEIDDDDATELLEEALSDSEAKRARQIDSLNRLWNEMEHEYELPDIALFQTGKYNTIIDAQIITDREFEFASEILENWQQESQLGASILPGLLDSRDLLTLYQETGVRRQELAKILYSDWIHYDGNQHLIIRPNNDRTVKTPKSNRVITISHELRNKAIRNTKYLFHNLNKTSASLNYGLGAITAAIRYATGNEKSRIHHCRHSRSSKGIIKGFTISDPIGKIRHFATVAADLGHSNLKTTLSSYSHLTHYALSISSPDTIDSLSNKALANLFRETQDRQRQHRSRSRAGNFPLIMEYTRRLADTTTEENILKPPIPDLPDIFTQSHATPLKENMTWLLRYVRGKSPFQAAKNLRLSVDMIHKLLLNIRNVQQLIRWQCVNDQILETDIKNLESNKGHFVIDRTNHKHFPVGWLDQQIQKLNSDIYDLPEALLHHLFGLYWSKNGGVYITMTAESASRFHLALSEVGLEFHLSDIPNKLNIFRISSLLDNNESKHQANNIKLLFFGCLVQSAAGFDPGYFLNPEDKKP